MGIGRRVSDDDDKFEDVLPPKKSADKRTRGQKIFYFTLYKCVYIFVI